MRHIIELRLNRLKWRHWILISLLVIITLVKVVPSWGITYARHIYPVIGRLLSPISGIIPFAVGDIFIAFSIVWCIVYPIYKREKAALLRVVEYLLWVYIWFYLAWGLNYSQPNIFHRMGMKPAKVSEAKLREFAYQYADSINALSEERSVKSGLSEEQRMKSKKNDALEEKTAAEVLKGYQALGKENSMRTVSFVGDYGINAPFNQHPHVKTMVFSRLSSMAGVTGSMGPFFCEFTLNGDVRPHDYPSTYAHEFAHFLGIANEGEANFYSYIVCTASSDKKVKFSGYYHIFFHVLNNVFNILGEEEGEKYLKRIRPEIIQLAKNDRRYWLSKRCQALDAAQDFIFDLYLRGNHVAEGRKSYLGVIGLILSWENQRKPLQIHADKW